MAAAVSVCIRKREEQSAGTKVEGRVTDLNSTGVLRSCRVSAPAHSLSPPTRAPSRSAAEFAGSENGKASTPELSFQSQIAQTIASTYFHESSELCLVQEMGEKHSLHPQDLVELKLFLSHAYPQRASSLKKALRSSSSSPSWSSSGRGPAGRTRLALAVSIVALITWALYAAELCLFHKDAGGSSPSQHALPNSRAQRVHVHDVHHVHQARARFEGEVLPVDLSESWGAISTADSAAGTALSVVLEAAQQGAATAAAAAAAPTAALEPITIPETIKASRSPWQALAVAAGRLQPEQQGGSTPPNATLKPPAARAISGLEAVAVLDLFLAHLAGSGPLGTGAPAAVLPHELALPQAQPLLHLLRRVWRAHRSPAASAAAADVDHPTEGAALPPDHCATVAGQAKLLEAAKAASELARSSCGAASGGSPGDGKGTGLPYVMLRRMSLAMLLMVYDVPPKHQDACRAAADKVSWSIHTSFASALNCSRASRHATELLHISKSGGTSMCQLAASSKLFNPGANMNANCLVPRLYDEPKWTRLMPGQDRSRVWPAVSCPDWLREPSVGCEARANKLKAESITFSANEVGLHEGTAALGSARACPQLETVVVLRDPLQRARSHVTEVVNVYQRFRPFGNHYFVPKDLSQWNTFAPAVIDNYMTRSLLGRHYLHCRDFGTIGEAQLLAASLALSSLDHVLVLDEDELNDVVMQAGMGWQAGLRSKRWRWSSKPDLQRDAGFPSSSMSLLKKWNQVDHLLLLWGRAMLRLDSVFHSGSAVASAHVAAGPAASARTGRAAAAEKPVSMVASAASSQHQPISSVSDALRHARLRASAASGLSVRIISGYVHMDDERPFSTGGQLAVPSYLLPLGMLRRLMSTPGSAELAACSAEGGQRGCDQNSTASVVREGVPAEAVATADVSVAEALVFKLPLYASMPRSPRYRAPSPPVAASINLVRTTTTTTRVIGVQQDGSDLMQLLAKVKQQREEALSGKLRTQQGMNAKALARREKLKRAYAERKH